MQKLNIQHSIDTTISIDPMNKAMIVEDLVDGDGFLHFEPVGPRHDLVIVAALALYIPLVSTLRASNTLGTGVLQKVVGSLVLGGNHKVTHHILLDSGVDGSETHTDGLVPLPVGLLARLATENVF